MVRSRIEPTQIEYDKQDKLIRKMLEQIAVKKETKISPEETSAYYYKYEEVKSTEFYFTLGNSLFNFLWCRVGLDRVEIQVEEGKVITLDCDNPESVCRIIASILAQTNANNKVANFDKEFNKRGIVLEKVRVVKGTLPLVKDRIPVSEVIVDYEITNSVVTSGSGVAIGEKISLVSIGGVQRIVVATTSGYKCIPIDSSDALFDQVTNYAEKQTAEGQIFRI